VALVSQCEEDHRGGVPGVKNISPSVFGAQPSQILHPKTQFRGELVMVVALESLIQGLSLHCARVLHADAGTLTPRVTEACMMDWRWRLMPRRLSWDAMYLSIVS